MKICVKQLVALANSKTPPDRAGWLLKRGEVNKSFQKRWFVLRGNLLFYSERPDRDPVGLIVLEGCSIELAECSETEKYAFLVIFHGPGARTYTMAADSQEEMEGWMKALSCANYDFLRNTVAELQRQIDEIRSAASRPESTGTISGSDSPLLDPVSPRAQLQKAATSPAVREAKSPSSLSPHEGKSTAQSSPSSANRETKPSGPIQASPGCANREVRSVPQLNLSAKEVKLPTLQTPLSAKEGRPGHGSGGHSHASRESRSIQKTTPVQLSPFVIRSEHHRSVPTIRPINIKDSKVYQEMVAHPRELKPTSAFLHPQQPNVPPRKRLGGQKFSTQPTSSDGSVAQHTGRAGMSFEDLHARYGARIQEVYNVRVIDFL